MILDLQPVIARLQGAAAGFKAIGASADLDAAIDGVLAAPAAFVLPLAEAATAMDTTGRTGQRITQLLGVVLCVANRRDAKGAAALNDLHALRLLVRAALVGWIPNADTAEPVHFLAGRLMKMDGDGRLWWIDEFELVDFYWSA